MLEKLSQVLKRTTDKIANALFLDKNLVEQIVKDLQRALIEADVNVQLVLEMTQKLRKAALDERIRGIEKKEHMLKLLHDELIRVLGEKRELKLNEKRNVFMLVGLYGSGKTTSISKIASYYAKRGTKVATLGLDVHRPAASEQLKQLCDKLNIPAFIAPEEKDPKKIYKRFEAQLKEYKLVIIDTAGRDALSSDLIKELKDIAKLAKPTETFLVMSADIGQAAKKQAAAFKDACDMTGVIVTKMDSTAKAGGALTACAEVRAPVVFIGTGEKPADLESFDPESFLSRLLGMGDLKSLMEKIQSVVDKDTIAEQQKRLEEGKFTMDDFAAQLDSVSSMGSFDKILSHLPGFGALKEKVPADALQKQEAQVKHWKAAVKSMTREEKESPELLEKQTSRMQRIAHGSGTTVSDVRALVKQFLLLKGILKEGSSLKGLESGSLDQKTMMKLAKKFARKVRL